MWWSLLFRLAVAHAITDCVFQDPKFSSMGTLKNPCHTDPSWHGHWPYWMLAHGLLNGTGVWWATGVWWLGWIETVVHSGIDYGKCRGWYTVHGDQLLHALSKLAYLLGLSCLTALSGGS